MLESLQDKWNPMCPQPEDYENQNQADNQDDPDWIEFNPKVTVEGELTEAFRIFTQPEINPDPVSRAPNMKPARHRGDKITVYTDGSATENGKENARAGTGIFYGEDDPRNRAIRVPNELNPSNQVAELLAVKEVLENTPRGTPIDIISDSKYTIDGVTKNLKRWEDQGYRMVANGDLVKMVVTRLRRHKAEIRFKWVKGHSGVAGNEAADRLAAQGAAKDQPDLINNTVKKGLVVHGAKLSEMTQSLAYKIIRQTTMDKDSYQDALDRNATRRNMEYARAAAEEANNEVPTEKDIWRATRHKDFSRNIRFFMWMLVHGGYKVGDHWKHIPGHEEKRTWQEQIWDMASELWQKENSKGTSRLFRIVVSESAHLIWRIRNERVIDERDAATTPEIQNRWRKAINTRLNLDRILTDVARYGKKALNQKLVESTWEKVLMDEDNLPKNWTRETGVLQCLAWLAVAEILDSPQLVVALEALFADTVAAGRGAAVVVAAVEGGSKAAEAAPKREDDGTQLAEKFEQVRVHDELDEKLGFARVQEGLQKEGWLVNMHPTLVKDAEWPSGKAAVDFYFIQDDGSMFKCTYHYEPYFHICCKNGTETTIEEWLMKKYEGLIVRIVRERKEDLKMPNHLMGHRRLYLQLCFRNVSDLLAVRRDIVPLALANSAKRDAVDAYAEVVSATAGGSMEIDFEGGGEDMGGRSGKGSRDKDPREGIIDVREYDVPYYLRVAIDNDIRVGLWYAVTFTAGQPGFRHIAERVKRADPVVMAYDIETTKAPLKFPDQSIDQVMMISYMVDGQGYLITNREIVSEDIEDFEYTPKDGYEGPFIIFNEADEAATIMRFFSHIQEVKPTVMATFNGDFFDFPFLDARAKANGIDMFLETGFAKDSEDEYKSRTCVHMDCFRWVKRDSYLPQGSQGLKAVTQAKLGYNPIELDPELMTPYALEQPQVLAQYSVSDAVATYYLYMKYVHPFIFSLCNIIPLKADEVLRKGSGTLCETLLMVEAYRGQIIMPNRHEETHGNMYEGHLLASETYVGGHVEALEAGVFRSDIPTHFKIEPSAIQQLIDDLDAALTFCIVEESKSSLENVTNYDEIKESIQKALELMRDNPLRVDKPLIYHLDVAAMYPNIMLSNRLQPDSMVDEAVCAVCDYNRPGKTCDRRLDWAWRGEFFPAHRDEFNMIKHALNQETFPPRRPGGPQRRFPDLTEAEQTALLHKRLGDYSRKVYKKTKDTKVETRESIVCQRENPFYVDTVRTFRDRRYEYKGLHKTWKKNLDAYLAEGRSLGEVDEAKKMIVLYDSLQLAHKCILNSFYGYVMRKGARWHSMEMAGITCLTGATIIQMARALVEQIGRPLELDTDGIWCMLPGVFPENFKFKLDNGKAIAFSYPCTMLNHLVHAKFTNHQYHDLDPNTGEYVIHSENSIFFELDGPYKAMILPSSKEEDKLLKKRYAVFNDDGTLAELKGFEVKRRGELQLIKIFQSQIFEKFLLGTTTEECYAAVAQVADQWLDVLFSHADSLGDDELVDLIAENRSMSKTLAEYGGQKSTSISTAKRLAEFLGDQMVKDKGLACKFIISAKPIGAPVTERAVPVAIFSAEEAVKRTYLRKWLKDNSLTNFELRSILDWQYYIERLGSVIQKLITIPAAMQKVANPVPRIRHPDWLHRRVAGAVDKFKQNKVTDFFKILTEEEKALQSQQAQPRDMEDFGAPESGAGGRRLAVVTKKARKPSPEPEDDVDQPVPDPSVDYSGWIKAMRPRWKYRQEMRSGSATTIVPAMFKNTKVRTNRKWDVLQIRPSKTLGRYILWLSVDSDIISLPLRIPREFYINLRTPKEEIFQSQYYSWDKVTRSLPRDLISTNLYKIVVREDVYQEIHEHFIDLINDPNVDGVFELQLPLHTIGLDLSQIDRSGSSLSRHKYLDGGREKKYIFIYHACSTNAPLHLFAVFLPSGPVKLHLVDPATRRQPIPRLASTYADLLAKFQQESYATDSLITYPESLEFTTTYHGNETTALKAVSRELGLLEDKSFIVAISSMKDLEYFERLVPKLSKFPVLSMSQARSAHTLDVFPWQTRVPETMLKRYLSLGNWLDRMVSLADYYDVPVGHVVGDQPLFMADISFARRLIHQDMVLCEEFPKTEFISPGSYSNVCLEIVVRNLAVNSVLHSVVVNELEGSGGATAFDSVSRTMDEYTNGETQRDLTLGESNISTQTFGILRAMVKAWLLDKIESKFAGPANLALDHFWRWISSSASHMYDPSIHRFVHGLMRKTFIQLLAEFKRLGSHVVYADFSRILLATSKPPGTAHAYATYITTAVNSHELFQHIYLNTQQFYDFLLFMDQANMGGIVCLDPLAVEPPDELTMEMQWNIASFLPPALQQDFHAAIQYYIVELFKLRQRVNNSGRAPLRVIRNADAPPDATQRDSGKIKEMEAIQEFIARRLTRKLLKIVGSAQERYRDATMDDELFE
ncbi:DNA polymerase epsilon catalytic subunit [Mycena sanguinolenta]|uniref:DNA polymerase epsilon catalytic subunit n=1 Tax=Mycena sanguinolenta TaxID=230812 RepID=A0A8H6YY62_9AGAR|nr:DNA polymerase epsilon catalytic subunit [Mycena sanguinolenta]